MIFINDQQQREEKTSSVLCICVILCKSISSGERSDEIERNVLFREFLGSHYFRHPSVFSVTHFCFNPEKEDEKNARRFFPRERERERERERKSNLREREREMKERN